MICPRAIAGKTCRWGLNPPSGAKPQALSRIPRDLLLLSREGVESWRVCTCTCVYMHVCVYMPVAMKLLLPSFQPVLTQNSLCKDRAPGLPEALLS